MSNTNSAVISAATLTAKMWAKSPATRPSSHDKACLGRYSVMRCYSRENESENVGQYPRLLQVVYFITRERVAAERACHRLVLLQYLLQQDWASEQRAKTLRAVRESERCNHGTRQIQITVDAGPRYTHTHTTRLNIHDAKTLFYNWRDITDFITILL